MAEEHEHTHGLSHGSHANHEKSSDKDKALYWGLGLSAVGVLIAVLLFMGGGKKKSSQPTTVNASQPFIPNPTDVSIGTMNAPMFWPGLPTSGTPTKPKTHHHGEKEDHDKDDKKVSKHGHTNHSNDKKGYGKSPTGASHGHAVSAHNVHNPKTVAEKGKANG
jgi:ABC-type nickel/cobalt efflux system permease component RcnA